MENLNNKPEIGREEARKIMAKEFGINSVEEDQILEVHSLRQAILASQAGYPFIIKGLKPLDEELSEGGF